MRAPVLAVVSTIRVAGERAETWGRTPVPAQTGLGLDPLPGVVPAAQWPWLQRIVHAAVRGVREWLRSLCERVGGWGAGADRAWAAR